MTTYPSQPGLLRRMARSLFGEHEEKIDFPAALRRARETKALSEDSAFMIEGVLKIAHLVASDIMVPRSQIKAIDLSLPKEKWFAEAVASGHSRFPVVDVDFSDTKGLLHAKDLLRSLVNPDKSVEGLVREAKFVPESESLNLLLKEFRRERQHLALVIDEFGEVTGLVTLEDILEEIVGDIDDEFDTEDPEAGNIVADGRNKWRVRAVTHIEQFNEQFGTNISDPHCETIGGIVSDRLERVPAAGDVVSFGGFSFKVVSADARQAKVLLAERVSGTGAGEPEAEGIVPEGDCKWRVSAATSVERFNEVFGTNIENPKRGTIGDIVSESLGRAPAAGDVAVFGGFSFKVVSADARKAKALLAERLRAGASPTEGKA